MTTFPAAGYIGGDTRTEAEVEQAFEDWLAATRQLVGAQAISTLTIASGAVTPTRGTHAVDTEALAASDDLDTISTANLPDGSWLLIFSADNARNVVVRHNQGGAGKILLADGANLTLDDTSQWLLLRRSGIDWVEVDRGYGNQKVLWRAFLGAAGLADANVYTRTQTWRDGGDVATTGSALGLPDGQAFNLTGTANVPGFASKGVGTIIIVRHAAAHTLVHHATDFICKGAASVVCAAGDHSAWHEYATGQWRMISFDRADGTALVASSAFTMPPGSLVPYAGIAAPSGWLLCGGQAVSRATYAALFAALCPSLGGFTVTIASPAVVTLGSHGLRTGDRIRLSTTGALPTGLSTNTDYYVNRVDANSFNLSATPGGANINTSGSQSGSHSAQSFAHGAGDGSTTFNLPDLRGRVVAGADAMGGTAAGRLTSAGAGIFAEATGAAGGTQTHTLSTPEIPSHSHTMSDTTVGTGSGSQFSRASFTPQGSPATSSAGGGGAHQNTQPTITLGYIIKT